MVQDGNGLDLLVTLERRMSQDGLKTEMTGWNLQRPQVDQSLVTCEASVMPPGNWSSIQMTKISVTRNSMPAIFPQ